jgi:hypothetical protein
MRRTGTLTSSRKAFKGDSKSPGRRTSKMTDSLAMTPEDAIDAALENLNEIGHIPRRPVLGEPMPPAEQHLKEEILYKLSSQGKWHPRRLVLTSELLAFAMEDGDVMIDCIPVLEIAEGRVMHPGITHTFSTVPSNSSGESSCQATYAPYVRSEADNGRIKN